MAAFFLGTAVGGAQTPAFPQVSPAENQSVPESTSADSHPPKPSYAVRHLRAVPYAQRPDGALVADVYLPVGEGPFPGLLLVHGGAWRAGSKWSMLRHGNQAAQRGYIAVAINYRLAPEHRFPAQLDDCREAVRWIRRQADPWNLDPKRVAAFGYSAGGHLAALLGVCEDQVVDGVGCRVQAVVAGGAPCDFLSLDPSGRTFAYLLGGSRQQRPLAYRMASPTWFASPDDPPFYFFHGEHDALVPQQNARELWKRLVACGVPATFDVVANCGHAGAFLSPTSLESSLSFLDEKLAPPESPDDSRKPPTDAPPSTDAPTSSAGQR